MDNYINLPFKYYNIKTEKFKMSLGICILPRNCFIWFDSMSKSDWVFTNAARYYNCRVTALFDLLILLNRTGNL